MPFAASMSEHPDIRQATGEVIGDVLERLGDQPDLAVFFVTADHAEMVADVADTVRRLVRPRTLVGATAASVVGGEREVEEAPAIVLWAGQLGGPAAPVRLEALSGPEGWAFVGLPPDANGPSPAEAETAEESGGETGRRHMVLLVDPYSLPADALVELAATEFPRLRVVGGLASGAIGPGGNRLVLDDTVYVDGAVGVVLPPTVGVTTVVSQGCRPIGEPMVVTRAERNILFELAGKPALERLAELVQRLDPDDRALAQRGIHLGRVIDETKERFGRGDFLIRNVIGGDRKLGAIAVGDEVGVGSTVQFQVRDAGSADEDLRLLLAGREAAGALVFTCNGRGSHLFDQAGHDAALVDAVTTGATAGMFCAGELGPVGDRSFLHGFTASVVLFTDR
ncbi:MAG: FIST signal transduction protein [Acidimicrobiales bacterium]